MVREALTRDRLRAMEPGEASAYFVARGIDGLSPSEQELLADWLAADPAHSLAYDRAQQVWQGFDEAQDDEILAAMRAHARTSGSHRWQTWRLAAAAAMLIVVVGIGLLILPSRESAGGPAGGAVQVAWTRYVSAHGQVRDVKLPDGSIMTLDTDSVAQAGYTPRGRTIRLERGRALFEVTRDESRPFAVAAVDRTVVALGTRFEVDTNDGGLRVSLFRGRLAIHPVQTGGQTVLLDAGRRFIERGGIAKVEPIGQEGKSDPAWLSGLIELDDISLGDALKQVNRYSREQIAADPSVAAIRVSGQFRAGDAGRFAQTLAEIYPVRVVRRGNAIELVSAK